jgi:putative two-component system response regulator
VAIADVYDALTNDRCYKKAFTPDEAFDMIMNGQCGTFSAKILKAFEKTRDEFERLAKEVASRA